MDAVFQSFHPARQFKMAGVAYSLGSNPSPDSKGDCSELYTCFLLEGPSRCFLYHPGFRKEVIL